MTSSFTEQMDISNSNTTDVDDDDDDAVVAATTTIQLIDNIYIVLMRMRMIDYLI